jgi:hypothetical protein
VDTALSAAGVRHAFGGALALAYHTAEPRSTVDIDVNIATPVDRAADLLQRLPAGVAWSSADVRTIERDGQVRLYWQRTPLDLFFPQHELHDEVDAYVERVPFGSARIPILSATHLCVFKALFDREKDWVDIGEMLAFGKVDRVRVEQWLTTIVGEADPRLRKWAARCATADANEPSAAFYRLPAVGTAKPRAGTRCGAPLPSGGHCSRRVQLGQRCWQHRGQVSVQDI